MAVTTSLHKGQAVTVVAVPGDRVVESVEVKLEAWMLASG